VGQPLEDKLHVTLMMTDSEQHTVLILLTVMEPDDGASRLSLLITCVCDTGAAAVVVVGVSVLPGRLV
jgi:hypothetical protein